MSDRRGKPMFIEAPEELHREIRIAAITSGQSLRQWMLDAARAKLAGACPCEDKERPPAGE